MSPQAIRREMRVITNVTRSSYKDNYAPMENNNNNNNNNNNQSPLDTDFEGQGTNFSSYISSNFKYLPYTYIFNCHFVVRIGICAANSCINGCLCR